MRTFTDNAGRTWTIAINVDCIRRLRATLNIDLLEAVEGKLIERLVGDPILLCDCIYVICKPDADQRNISDEDFGRAMAGDAIEYATTSLLEELVDFFPRNRRELLSKALLKFRNLEKQSHRTSRQAAGRSTTREQPHGSSPSQTLSARSIWKLIWQLAGIVGVHPGPLTLRELVWMAEAHRKEAWQHTSTIIATLANIHRDPKKKPNHLCLLTFNQCKRSERTLNR